MTDHYCLLGNPVAQSKSPQIHSHFAQETKQDLQYHLVCAPLDAFDACLQAFFAGGGHGCNVTVPFKEQALAAADDASEEARAAGAANTLWRREDGSIYADNTDGRGLVVDLCHNHGLSLAKQRILLLGAGGAARGAIAPLLAQQPAQLFIANRSADKARALAKNFTTDVHIDGGGFAELPDAAFDLIINATSAGLSGATPNLSSQAYHAQTIAYDMLYSDRATPFQIWADKAGFNAAYNGYGMLIEQAAEAFSLWRGVRPETALLLQRYSSLT